MPWPEVVRSQGNLVADEVAVLSAKISGRLSQATVELGQKVVAGEIVIKFDPAEFEMQVAQADAQLLQARSAVGLKPGEKIEKLEPRNAPPVREAQAIYSEAKSKRERWEVLKTQQIAATEEYEQVVSAEKVAEAKLASAMNGVMEKIALIRVRMAELDLAQDRLSETTIVAPFDGIVQQRHVTTGTFVQVGQPLVTVVKVNPLRFQGTVPERVAQSIAVGQKVRLQVESIAEPRVVTVTRVSPTLEARSRALMFEAQVDNVDQRLRAGLFAEAEVVLNATATATVVPRSALVEFAGVEKVWKISGGRLNEQSVRTGRRSEQYVEILQGLKPGDQVLVEGRTGRTAAFVGTKDGRADPSPLLQSRTR
jgi:RND family efflux transporter MFP subunit